MPIEKEGRKRSLHRRTGRGNQVYISSKRKTTEIVNQLLSGEGKLLTNDGEKLKRGLSFFAEQREHLMPMRKRRRQVHTTGLLLHCLTIGS